MKSERKQGWFVFPASSLVQPWSTLWLWFRY